MSEMIDEERLLTFKELVAAFAALHGVRLHVSTLHRWRKGIRGRRLKATRLGGRWFGRLCDLIELTSQSEPNEVKPRNAPTPSDVQRKLNTEFQI